MKLQQWYFNRNLLAVWAGYTPWPSKHPPERSWWWQVYMRLTGSPPAWSLTLIAHCRKD